MAKDGILLTKWQEFPTLTKETTTSEDFIGYAINMVEGNIRLTWW